MSTVSLLRKIEETERTNAPAAGNGFDLPRLERAVREMLFAVGEDSDRDGLRDTMRRVARAYRELLGGLHDDPVRHLGRVFEHRTDSNDLVLVRDIEFSSVCEHHLLPFTGTAQVAYLPASGRVVGLRTRGPYALWHHTHEFEPGDGGTIIRDRVRYRLPFGALGDWIAGGLVRRDLVSIFDFRRQRIQELLG